MARVNRALQVVGILYIDIGRGPAFDYGKARYDSAVGTFYTPVSLIQYLTPRLTYENLIDILYVKLI
jgi:hypothetical protein